MELNQWLTWMGNNHQQAIRLGLEQIIPIADELKVRKFPCPVITVTGTNGKGSCVKVLESILLQVGFKVGLYTSPHILEYNERIRINGKNITDNKCIEAFNVIKNLTEKYKTKLTFFEFATLAALYNFKQEDLDILILEVGLGGRLDAVNVVFNDIAVITTIDLDHMEFLGDTREKIAFEKAGIFKQNGIAVCGEFDPPDAIFNVAKNLNIKLSTINNNYKYNDGNTIWDYLSKDTQQNRLWENLMKLPKPNLPLQNVATALRTLELLEPFLQKHHCNFCFSKDEIHSGLKNAFLPARMQTIMRNKLELIFDVAHNPHATKYLAKKIASLPYKKNYAIFSMQKTKDLQGSVECLSQIFSEWHIVDIDAPNAVSARELQYKMQNILTNEKINICNDAVEFLDSISNDANTRVIIFGSFYAVAKVFKALGIKLH